MSYLARKDKIVPALIIEDGRNQFRIDKNPGGVADLVTVTVPPGKYYAYRADPSGDSNTFVAGFPPLYNAIEDAMTAAWAEVGEEFFLSHATPTSSTAFENAGIEIEGTGGPFALHFDIAADTLPAKILGMDKSVLLSAPSGGNDVATGKFTTFGNWISPRRSQSKLGDRENIQTSNRGNSHEVSQTVHWHQSAVRTIKYDWIFANHVSIGRNSDPSYAGAGLVPLAEGDHGNYFGDCWSMLSLRDLALFVYDEGDAPQGLQLTNVAWEIGRLSDTDAAMLSRCSQLASERGEIYNLTMTIWRMPKERVREVYGDIDAFINLANYYEAD